MFCAIMSKLFTSSDGSDGVRAFSSGESSSSSSDFVAYGIFSDEQIHLRSFTYMRLMFVSHRQLVEVVSSDPRQRISRVFDPLTVTDRCANSSMRKMPNTELMAIAKAQG